jgi:hypothetical protein
MKDKPDIQSVNERLDRLDQSWQDLVKMLNEGQVEPSTQRVEPEMSAPEEAGASSRRVTFHPQSLTSATVKSAPRFQKPRYWGKSSSNYRS